MPPLGGDPTTIGWTITLAYAVVAWRCWRARRGCAGAERRMWMGLAILLALLCVNKQLDLQTAVTAGVRAVAKEQGWYESRRPVQIAVLAIALGLAGALGAYLAWLVRPRLPRIWPAIAGFGLILGYIALRMSSVHEVDVFVVGGPFPMKWWGELVGLALIAWGAAAPRPDAA